MKIILLTMKDYRKLNKVLPLLAFIFLLGCKKDGLQEFVYTGTAIGTTYQLKFFHTEEINVEKGIDSIFDVINHSMSTYKEDSDISRINAGDTTIAVDHNFLEVFRYSAQIHKESGGYFDPTVGNLVNAYGFGPEGAEEELDRREIDSMLQYVGFNKLSLKPGQTISKTDPAVYLDFNAIAKGYAVDVIGSFLDRNNVQDYLIEVGGELVAKGINRGREQPWLVAIDDPMQTEGNRTFKATLKLQDRAMATSGNYRKFRKDPVTGQQFVHTINPLTGLSEKSNLLSASVLAGNCTLADGYATAFMAMGLEGSKEMLKGLENVDVYFIYSGEGEEVNVFTTEGFEQALVE